MKGILPCIVYSAIVLIAIGCANIVPPSGGPKDETPPKLVNVSPKDSQLHTRVHKIELQFNEYITLNDAATQVQISPLLTIPLTVSSQLKKVSITIPDSLLLDETTYRITYGTAIRDLHEGNIYPGKGYTFSTGTYFDSLSIAGTVHSAHTGLADTAALVVLYSGRESDSAIVRHKPMYITHTDASGKFLLQGLPPRPFRIYALRDANNNLTFDGGNEWIAFIDSAVMPSTANPATIDLRTFAESAADTVGPLTVNSKLFPGDRSARLAEKGIPPGSYRVGADTSDTKRRSFDISLPLTITFGRRLSGSINKDKIFLSVDSAGTTIEAPVRIAADSSGLTYRLFTTWQENALYTLRLQKGFAKDSTGADLFPGRFSFRTKRDEDYGKLRIHLPSKYYGPTHILQVANERDTIYQQPVTDTMVALFHVPPGVYTMRIIEDKNRNGRWDAGDLFLKRQPEVVIPYNNPVNLKAGWEQQLDFIAPRKKETESASGSR